MVTRDSDLTRRVAEEMAGPMTEALAEAEAAMRAGDVPVGAVVLDADVRIIGRGRNVRERDGDPTGHAEVVALREAAATLGRWRLDGTTLVVTLEPCLMCAGAVLAARVDRLIYGAADPKAGAVGSLWDVVRDPRVTHRTEVAAGVQADRATALLDAFFATRR